MRLRLALLVPVLLLVGCASEGKRLSGIDNFSVVREGPDAIYRGAQPTPEGFETLRARGVKTIINLRDDPLKDEPTEVEKAGMTYVHISTNAGRIERGKINQFLQAMKKSPRPVFVHCAYGCDRTGLNIAVYRIVVEGWSREDAVHELYRHGYHWAVFPGYSRYLKTFPLSDYLPGTSS